MTPWRAASSSEPEWLASRIALGAAGDQNALAGKFLLGHGKFLQHGHAPISSLPDSRQRQIQLKGDGPGRV
jgi:hypothetical protein